MLQKAFDKYASQYDQHFTYSLIGKEQRKRVYRHLISDIKNSNSVLEVNCGTGEDAIWLAKQNKQIIATDISSEMISIAKKKDTENKIDFQTLNAIHINSISDTFDVIFSNFGGLNCLNEDELKLFFNAAHLKLNKTGIMILVFISSNCIWEKWYFKLKGKFFRRKHKSAVDTTINNESFSTYYYSPDDIAVYTMNDFKIIKLKPIGLFIPPSYMESKMKKYSLLFKMLVKLEGLFGNISRLANKADHFYIALEKK